MCLTTRRRLSSSTDGCVDTDGGTFCAERVQVRKSVSENDFGPIVVHCSAGVGRAGSFVTVDVQLEKYATEKQIDVFAGMSYLCFLWLLM